jgi:Tol biopolymer transport system component
MTLSSGERLGPYQIVAAIGAGGMGEVYRAQDTRLHRVVAIKVLPAHLAAKTEARERFEREARAISSLNHPHICRLYDVGSKDGVSFLVMEHLEGVTLADQLQTGALPQDQALRFGREILDALDRAHRNGIVHRDLKPANVMITRDGAKLLDFGLAKLHEATSPPEQTISMTLTTEGAIVGTFQYMAPEQLEGKDADARTDIFTFGAVMYEMLTGRKAFAGKSQASLISSIMTASPQPMPPVPPGLERIVRRCLEKDPEERWQSARDLSQELKRIAEGVSQAVADTSPAGRKSRAPTGWIVAVILVLALAAIGVIELRRSAVAPPKLMHFQILLPPGLIWTETGLPAISPDGSRVVFNAFDAKQQKFVLVTRAIDSTTVQQLAVFGSSQVGFVPGPFWSPDSKQVGFFSEGRLKKIAIAGGAPETLCEVHNGVNPRGAWSEQGVVLFAPNNGSPLFQVSEQGGEARPVLPLDSSHGEISHSGPQFLPDGKRFLFQIQSQRPESSGVYLGSLDGKSKTRLIATAFNAAFTPGYLVFVRGEAIVAQPFDSSSARLQGEPVTLASPVWTSSTTMSASFASFSVSATGLVAYRPGEFRTTPLVWFDRQGRRLETVGEAAQYSNPALSPDGRRLAVGRSESQTRKRDIWVIDLTRGVSSRLTSDPADEMNPVWSPDGTRIAFSSDRRGLRDLYVKPASGVGDETLLEQSEIQKSLLDWSPEGKFLTYTGNDKLWILPLSGDRKPQALLTGGGNFQAAFSPDGKWLAYRSFESGRPEVYVQPFPFNGEKWPISTSGGGEAYWRHDGKELFYLSGNALMAVPIKPGAAGFDYGPPLKLFDAPVIAAMPRNRFVPSLDGQRFLMVTASEQVSSAPIEILVNWMALLKH